MITAAQVLGPEFPKQVTAALDWFDATVTANADILRSSGYIDVRYTNNFLSAPVADALALIAASAGWDCKWRSDSRPAVISWTIMIDKEAAATAAAAKEPPDA